LLQALGQVAGVVRDPEPAGHFLRGFLVAARERDHLDTRNVLDGFQMLDAERALTRQTYFHGMNLAV
jgi:hypothetical protein